jgi:hypothetical protein
MPENSPEEGISQFSKTFILFNENGDEVFKCILNDRISYDFGRFYTAWRLFPYYQQAVSVIIDVKSIPFCKKLVKAIGYPEGFPVSLYKGVLKDKSTGLCALIIRAKDEILGDRDPEDVKEEIELGETIAL